MIFDSLTVAAARLRSGEYSPKELLDETYRRIEQTHYNAILHICKDEAFRRAEELEKSSVRGALYGVPVIVKDNIMAQGQPFGCGSAVFAGKTAERNAFIVDKLLAAGAIIIGRANMDEFAMGSSNTTSAYGRVLHPTDPDRVPGGSSGGSACAVATYQCMAALGTDTGGSIRQPAAYCGIVGLKPTYGTVSRSGIFPLAPSFDQAGPLARTVGDCAAVYSAICGYDCADEASLRREYPVFAPRPFVKGRIGIIKEFADYYNEETLPVFRAALEKLKADGVEIIELSAPSFKTAAAIYTVIGGEETARSLKNSGGDLNLLGAEAKKRLLVGGYVARHPELKEKAEKCRRQLTAELVNAVESCDAVISPTAPSSAFRFDEDFGRKEIVCSDVFTQPASIAGLPALSVPFGGGSLPMGIQLFGRAFSEQTLFDIGAFLTDETR